ncbi:MAG: DUF4249 domain-containing protein [Polaribacter sp.]
MKFTNKYLFIVLSCIIYSCTDIIDVDVPTEATRLVIEASLDWEKGTTGNDQQIKLSLSAPYFSTENSTAVTNAIVTVVKNDDTTTFNFIHQADGIYEVNNFVPEIGTSYTLTVIYDGETYSATETLHGGPEISNIVQSSELFDEDLIELTVSTLDPANEENYYLLKFTLENDDLFPIFGIEDDKFVNGNEISFYYERDEEDSEHPKLETGDKMRIEGYAISERYFNYMSLLIEQSSDQGPFGTAPVPLKGNCINTTNREKDAYGYFRVTEVDRKDFTIQ